MSSLIFYAALAMLSSSPLSSSSTCPPCKKIQDCSSNYLGSYSLMEENSPYCPEVEGFTGCLYEKNGSLTKFCFKAGPLEQCSASNEGTCTGVTESDPDPKPTTAFDNTTDSTTSAESDTNTADSNIPQETTEPTNALNDISNTEPEIDGDEKTEDLLLKGAENIETTTTEQLPSTSTVRPCLKENFPNLALMSEAEVASLCCDESDCQDNAGCFQDELSDTFKTYCQCYLGHSLDNSTSSLPMTGDCQDMNTHYCSSKSACYETDQYRLCPYCHVTYKEATIGQYQSGNGIFDSDDPMIFTGSSSECAEETTSVFWYCWYDAMDQVVDLSQAYVLVETDECEHWAYIYTPLACPFAIET